MAISKFVRLIVGMVVLGGSVAVIGCGHKEEAEKAPKLEDIKLPPGQQFGYKPKK